MTLRKQPIDGVSLFEVEFKNVSLRASENVLGEVGAGYDITRTASDSARFLVGSASLGLLKRLYKQTVAYVLDTQRFGRALGDHLAVKTRLASIETRLYSMESVVYFTAGILDSYQMPDVSCESALAKIFCTDALRHGFAECLDLMGMGAYEAGGGDSLIHQSSTLINLLANMLTNNEVLRLQVATSGVLQAGIEFGDQVVKHRNPLMYPKFIFKQFLINRKLVSLSFLSFMSLF